MVHRTHSGHVLRFIAALLMIVPAAWGGTKVPAVELEEAVRGFLVGQRAGEGDLAEISFRSVPENIEVSGNSYRLHVINDGRTQWKGAVAVCVEIEADGRVLHRCMVSALVRTYADVLVAERAIERYAQPGSADVRTIRMETTLIQRRVFLGTSSLTGLRSRHIIARGSILYEDLFEPVPMVQRGDRVNIRVLSGRVMLSTEGIARDDGIHGDFVTVELTNRRERVRGRIDGERCVTVLVDAGKEKR